MQTAHQAIGIGEWKRDARGTPFDARRLRMSLFTPAAVTAGPAPGPVITSGCADIAPS